MFILIVIMHSIEFEHVFDRIYTFITSKYIARYNTCAYLCARMQPEESHKHICATGNKEIHIILESDFGHVDDFTVETQLTVEFGHF